MTSARRADWSRIPIDRDDQDRAEQDEVEQGQGWPAPDVARRDPVDVTDADPDVEHTASARGAGPDAGLDAKTVEVPIVPDREDQAVQDQAVEDQAVQDSPGRRRSGPDESGSLRARVESLRARLGLEPASAPTAHRQAHSQVQEADAARRAQLAAWAEDDARHESGAASGEGRDASDEDGT